MLSERRDSAVVVRAPAKVNLFLEVLAKRPDGYHEIATLMVAVSLYDTLEFKEDPSGAHPTSTATIPSLTTGPDNLVLRAAELLRQRTGCARGARHPPDASASRWRPGWPAGRATRRRRWRG